MKRIGILYDKESKKRFLLPEQVRQLTAKGITVNIIKDMGAVFNIADSVYEEVGAKVYPDWKSVIGNSEILLKVNAFTKHELENMNGKMAITMVNYFNNVDMLLYMLQNGVTGIEWASLVDTNGYVLFPKLEELKAESTAMGIKQGLVDVIPNKLKNKVIYPPKPKILILNATFAGLALAKIALANGMEVTISDHDLAYLQNLQKEIPEIKICDANYETLLEVISMQNVFVVTTINPSDPTKLRITKEMAVRMPRGSLLIDMSAENGYSFHFAKKFLTKELKWIAIGKSFYIAPCDILEFSPKETTEIIAKGSVQYLIDVAENGTKSSFIARKINCENGKVVNPSINARLNLY
ncbi:MAG: hypothetical protein ACOQNY_01745 [Mycoplasmoidaceae bacterium]